MTEPDVNPGDGSCETVASGGVCTFSAAIQEANALANNPVGTPDEIRFAIPGAGVHTIQPASDLPTITQPVIIDGYTQDTATADPSDDARPNTLAVGSNATLLIELNLNGVAFPNALTITADNSTVRGLVINRFNGGNGLFLQTGGGNMITGNFIGTNAAGTARWALGSRGNHLQQWQSNRRHDARVSQHYCQQHWRTDRLVEQHSPGQLHRHQCRGHCPPARGRQQRHWRVY